MGTIDEAVEQKLATKYREQYLKQTAERIADIDRQLKGLDTLVSGVGLSHDLNRVRAELDIFLQAVEDAQRG